ncbi:MAG: hypothetical protein IJQ12_07310 [Lachnospiraceae bacterium]|nr:hypothetical protein [Lachnospiraceae bacterium]
MSITEIILIIIGFIAVIVGYVMPASLTGAGDELTPEEARKHMEDMVQRSLEDARLEIRDRIEDTLEETMVKSERGMERITNEQMNAISDYADSVLGDIRKNHDEVVFMYDMLNDKHKNLTNLVSDVQNSASESKQTVLDAELTAQEAFRTAQATMDQIRQAREELEALLIRARHEADDAAAAHAEAALPGMMRLDDNRFAPITQEFPHVTDEYGTHRVLQSTAPSEEEEASAQAAELVAKELQAKVVPITTGQQWHEIKTRADAPMTQDKQAQILAMHEQGKSQVAIARELAIGVGEVRLVIDLYGKQRKVKRA